MCDYSLELYKSVPAVEGASYQLRRFPSGTLGFTFHNGPAEATSCDTAACIKPGTQLHLAGISEGTQRAWDIAAEENVMMVHLEDGKPHAHHDAVRFSNGKDVLLQSLNPDIVCTLLPEDKSLVSDAPAAAPELIDAD